MIVIERGHVRSNGMNNEFALWEDLYGDTPSVRLVDVIFGPGAYVALRLLGCSEGYYGATTDLCCRIMRRSIGLVGDEHAEQAREDFSFLEKAAVHMEHGTYNEIRDEYVRRRFAAWESYVQNATTPSECVRNAISRAYTPDPGCVMRFVLKANNYDTNIHDDIRGALTIIAKHGRPDEAPHD